MKILGPRLLVVHGTQFTDDDLLRLKQSGAIAGDLRRAATSTSARATRP